MSWRWSTHIDHGWQGGDGDGRMQTGNVVNISLWSTWELVRLVSVWGGVVRGLLDHVFHYDFILSLFRIMNSFHRSYWQISPFEEEIHNELAIPISFCFCLTDPWEDIPNVLTISFYFCFLISLISKRQIVKQIVILILYVGDLWIWTVLCHCGYVQILFPSHEMSLLWPDCHQTFIIIIIIDIYFIKNIQDPLSSYVNLRKMCWKSFLHSRNRAIF